MDEDSPLVRLFLGPEAGSDAGRVPNGKGEPFMDLRSLGCRGLRVYVGNSKLPCGAPGRLKMARRTKRCGHIQRVDTSAVSAPLGVERAGHSLWTV